MKLKEKIKEIFGYLPLKRFRNQRYDRHTIAVMKRVLKPTSNCIDVGCHKGEILEKILKFSPKGNHFGFEPLPHLYQNLQQNFGHLATVSNIGLSDKKGTSTFNYVVSNPAYSGFLKRNYDRPNEKDTQITVETNLLDSVIPEDLKIDFIKIDVEGAELQVLRGAKKLLQNHRPVVVFEFGMGAASVYETTPNDIFTLFSEIGYKLNTMEGFLIQKPPFSLQDFTRQYSEDINYYFVAF